MQDRENETVRNVERSLAYMADNLHKPLQVATLAALANVSPSHFFALFKQRTGYPPMDYFTKLRMHHACRLLDSTSARVKEVAAALGYDDPFYFSRVFKSVSAVAPVHYRSLGLASRREIRDLLEPRDQMMSGDAVRRAELGRVPARGRETNHVSHNKTNQNEPSTMKTVKKPTKSGLTIPLVALCSTFASTAAFGQATSFIWTNQTDSGTSSQIGVAANWSPNGIPNPNSNVGNPGDVLQFDGQTTGPLYIDGRPHEWWLFRGCCWTRNISGLAPNQSGEHLLSNDHCRRHLTQRLSEPRMSRLMQVPLSLV